MSDIIPQIWDFDWREIYTKIIEPSDQPLVKVESSASSRVFVRAFYHEQHIEHALASCYLRKSVAERLLKAASFLPSGINLLVLDGWRPLEVQKELLRLFAIDIQNKHPDLSDSERQLLLSQFVAKPSADPICPSPHLTGGSVDLALCDDQQNILDMGSGFDEPTKKSWTCYYEQADENQQIRANRRLLYQSMIAAGFTNLPSEWWHYDYGNQLWSYFGSHPVAIYSSTNL